MSDLPTDESGYRPHPTTRERHRSRRALRAYTANQEFYTTLFDSSPDTYGPRKSGYIDYPAIVKEVLDGHAENRWETSMYHDDGTRRDNVDVADELVRFIESRYGPIQHLEEDELTHHFGLDMNRWR